MSRRRSTNASAAPLTEPWRVARHCCLTVALFLLILGGCRKAPSTQSEVARDTAERGPLKLTVEAGPRAVRVGDTVTVDVRVETPPDVVVVLPQEKDFGELRVKQSGSPESQPGASGIVWRRTFTLEPLASGALEIPALAVKYGRQTAGAESQPALENELSAGPLKLDVRSALTPQDKPEKPRDITGTLLPPRPPWPLWVWVLILCGVLVLVALTTWAAYLIRRRLSRPPPPILPEVWALRALADLELWDWFDPERVREYYYRLTEIVRRYIELKFGLAAPEMTTEEFLGALARDRQAVPYDAERLRLFLEACDFVKYAALSPQRTDAENVLVTARAFVNATAAASGDGVGSPADRAPPAGPGGGRDLVGAQAGGDASAEGDAA